jgi:hypothetical protein
MLLRKKNLAYPRVILHGLYAWTLGLFFNLLSGSPLLEAWLTDLLKNPSVVDFLQGLCNGLALGLFCTSIFISVRGYCTYRRAQIINQ